MKKIPTQSPAWKYQEYYEVNIAKNFVKLILQFKTYTFKFIFFYILTTIIIITIISMIINRKRITKLHIIIII